MRTVSRKAWGARAPENTPTKIGSVQGIAIHYTASNADEQSDHRNCAARVRGIQAFHMDANGWNDIAYNWVVCKHGYIFVGRGRGVRSAANGTNSGNDHFPAVVFLGDDTAGRDDVTARGRRALAELIAREAGLVAGAYTIRPHSCFKSTGCPGDDLRRFLGRMNNALAF